MMNQENNQNENLNERANKQTENLFNVTTPAGREMLLRPLPATFYMFYGELPANFTNKAIELMRTGDTASFVREVGETMTPEQIKSKLIMVRDAVKYICVKPRLTIDPQTDDKTIEITPLDLVPGVELPFLQQWAFQNIGGLAESHESFRNE